MFWNRFIAETRCRPDFFGIVEFRWTALFFCITACGSSVPADSGSETSHAWAPPTSLTSAVAADRIWLVSTRHLTSNTCRVELNSPQFRITRLDSCGRQTPSSIDEYLGTMSADRPRLVYVHGNRRTASFAIERGLVVYRELDRHCPSERAIDWVIWSWPSDKEALPLMDARIKAERTDAQSLYLAWMLHQHASAGQPTSLIGFSFGGRIATGALHALAGGGIDGRGLGLPPIHNARIDIGLIAPAVHSNWLTRYGQHRLATSNIDEMLLLYNSRDLVLKNYWLIDKSSGSQALGYTGPIHFAPRQDGSQIKLRANNCSSNVGTHHSEIEYYNTPCSAGRRMSTLIESSLVSD